MKIRHVKLVCPVIIFVLCCVTAFSLRAEEVIIQKEELSFERCLKVILASEKKLSIAPIVKDHSNEKRVAMFSLLDGTLTITCDGNEGYVTVSTNIK